MNFLLRHVFLYLVVTVFLIPVAVARAQGPLQLKGEASTPNIFTCLQFADSPLQDAPAGTRPASSVPNKIHISISLPVICKPVDENSDTMFGMGIEGAYEVDTGIAVCLALTTCCVELGAPLGHWVGLHPRARFALGQRRVSFVLRPGLALTYVKSIGSVDFSSTGFGFSLVMGPEIILSERFTLEIQFGFDWLLMPHKGQKVGLPDDVKSRYSLYGGICLRIAVPTGRLHGRRYSSRR